MLTNWLVSGSGLFFWSFSQKTFVQKTFCLHSVLSTQLWVCHSGDLFLFTLFVSFWLIAFWSKTIYPTDIWPTHCLVNRSTALVLILHFLHCLLITNAFQRNGFRPKSVAPCFSYEVLPWNLKHAPNMFADQAMTDMRLSGPNLIKLFNRHSLQIFVIS